MSSMRAAVLLWAQRVLARKGSPPHVVLEVAETASPQDIQNAFHKIARTSHPDLFRHGLDAAELEVVTSAYAVVAGAYQQMRSASMQTSRMRPLKPDDLPPVEPIAALDPPTVRTASATPPSGARVVQPPPAEPAPAAPPATPSGPAPSANAAQSMSPKALLYYRKAELCLKRGDLKGAVLQLKLACATDPTSSFLRTALAEVETEVRSKP